MKLLLASGNQKKREELHAMLAPLGIELLTPSDLGGIPDVIEDQDSFRGNAAKKALSATRATGLVCLADDSGLEVDALGGAPGVFSARYSGPTADDARNNAKLLVELAKLPAEKRSARFVCALALALPDDEGQPHLAAEFEGSVQGEILESAAGSGGFGYDPLFLFNEAEQPGCGIAFGDMTPAQKSKVSHRGRALTALVARLPELLTLPSPTAD
jgi:XTP/dITP diphosphohydrolase